MSVTDLAFYILKNRGQPVHFKELISEIMRIKSINQENPGRQIAQMHTEINLDSRFLHLGNGEWGLREWQPKTSKVVKIRPEVSSSPRSRPGLRPEEEDYGYEQEDEDDLVSDEAEDGYDVESDDYLREEDE